jgi:DNA integrity scanning protein DisA with diadenylate cyclase activity
MRREEVYIGFWWRNLRVGFYLKDLGVDGRIIKMNLKDVRSENMDESALALERKRRRASLNTVMNLRFP